MNYSIVVSNTNSILLDPSPFHPIRHILYSKLSKLSTLSLEHNFLVGSLPTELYDLSKLQELRLASNQVI